MKWYMNTILTKKQVVYKNIVGTMMFIYFL